MGRKAQVLSRRPGQIFMGQMLEALEVAEYAPAPDDLPLLEPGWTLFTFDLPGEEAVFVQTGAVDLSAAPFCYQAQYEGAQAVFRMGFDAFLKVASTMEQPRPVAHVFNMGHCGSTLLHAALNHSGLAFCISEPLFTFGLAMARRDLGAARITELMRAGLRFLGRMSGAERGPLIVKHFSQVTTIMEPVQAAVLGAVPLFMYRAAESWCASVHGFSQKMGVVPPLSAEQRHLVWWISTAGEPEETAAGILDLGEDGSSLEEIAALAWALHLRDYRAVKGRGVALEPLAYEDLVGQREAVLTALFARLGVPQTGVAAALRAFDADSHAGTATARDIAVLPMEAEGRARVTALLAHDRIRMTGTERLD